MYYRRTKQKWCDRKRWLNLTARILLNSSVHELTTSQFLLCEIIYFCKPHCQVFHVYRITVIHFLRMLMH